MASGIIVNSECLKAFQDLKQGRKHKYILYAVNDDKTEIVVSKTSESGDYDSFVETLPENECRYAVYDFEYEKPGGGKRSKLCFISWSPDTAKIKSKMIYSSSKLALRQALVGVAAEIQATAYDEITFEAVKAKVDIGA